MFTHIVFYRLIDNSEENKEKVKGILLSMEGKVEQLKAIEVGIDVLHSERSYDLALITRFDSMDDFKAYKAHPVHTEVSKFMHSVFSVSASVDYT